MRIVFMGTPDFAVPSLEILLHNGYDIAAVITAPDKPAGRGLKMTESPVKKFALEHALKILQPLKLKDENFLRELKSLRPRLQVVVAFRMLPEVVWNLPPKGTVNLHASLLPDYRGAAPINWAIINGEKESGLTTFFIEREIDTGKIIFQEKIAIGSAETAGELHDRMMLHGAGLVFKTVQAIERNEAPAQKQNFTAIERIAPKLTRENCLIDWNQNTEKIFDFIRGLSPYPAAWTILDGKIFKIFRAEKEIHLHELELGKFILSASQLKITAADGYIFPLEVQLEGKRKMPVSEFLKGYGFKK